LAAVALLQRPRLLRPRPRPVSARRRPREPHAPRGGPVRARPRGPHVAGPRPARRGRRLDRKSTRLNSSHVANSYAVFCLEKKIETRPTIPNSSIFLSLLPTTLPFTSSLRS